MDSSIRASGKTYLITGGAGFLGRALLSHLLADAETRRVIVYSRDEAKHAKLRQDFPDDRLDCFVGDVRDKPRLMRACRAQGIDVLIHGAALKRVDTCELDPDEAIFTNVLGSMNVRDAALAAGIPVAMLISSDKSCAPVNSYGKSKALAEAIFVRGNAYRGSGPTRFGVVRYGNVRGSTGSLLTLFADYQRRGEPFPLTSTEATRFWWDVDAAARFVLDRAEATQGGEIWVPRLESSRVLDLLPEGLPYVVTGLGPGEKLHEFMVSSDEAAQTYQVPSGYVIWPANPSWPMVNPSDGFRVPAGWSYSSRTNQDGA